MQSNNHHCVIRYELFFFLFFFCLPLLIQASSQYQTSDVIVVGMNEPYEGFSSALDTSGQHLIFGAPHNNGSAGAVIFCENGFACSDGFGLVKTGSNMIGQSRFGWSVDLQTENQIAYAIVGGPDDDSQLGAVWIYKRLAIFDWIEVTKITPPDNDLISIEVYMN